MRLMRLPIRDRSLACGQSYLHFSMACPLRSSVLPAITPSVRPVLHANVANASAWMLAWTASALRAAKTIRSRPPFIDPAATRPLGAPLRALPCRYHTGRDCRPILFPLAHLWGADAYQETLCKPSRTPVCRIRIVGHHDRQKLSSRDEAAHSAIALRSSRYSHPAPQWPARCTNTPLCRL